MTDTAPPTAAIVSVGNELLFGETVDTNAAWLGRTLTGRGITVTRRFTVRDDSEAIEEAVRTALHTNDLVIVTGGLGPTEDDQTRETVAHILGRRLVRDDSVLDDVRARFEAAGRTELPESSLSQADVPEGAEVMRNSRGTAPGLLLHHEGRRVVLLPGVPSEMKGLVEDHLLPRLEREIGLRPDAAHRTVHTTGIPESALADALEPALAALPPALLDGVDLAWLPDREGVDLRFTFRGLAANEVDARFGALVDALGPVLDPWRYESPRGDLADAVVGALRESGRTIAVAESCTGGWVMRRLTDHPGASDVVLGGVVAYANEVKVEQLGVPAGAIEAHGAVSEEVAHAMASGVAERFGASTSVSITGVAGPGGGSPEKPVGTVWIGTVLDGRAEAARHRFPGDRDSVRARAAQAALAALYRRMRAG